MNGIRLDVENVSYKVKLHQKDKVLLRNISFALDPGELCALMGCSGAGKSTLLDLLADRKEYGTWSGDIFFNRKPRSRWFARDSAYVLQDDVHIPTLTVEETIRYSAWTRLPEGTAKQAIDDRVNQLLDITGLSAVRNTMVGDSMNKGISGGQLKRLSIAVEIIALPSLICLDEPTSGLDSTIALETMEAVRRLAEQGRTCIATIHQPSRDIFELFDRVVLLSEGRLIYSGAAKDAVTYFTTRLGYTLENYKNPAEFIIEVSGGSIFASGRRTAYSSIELQELFTQCNDDNMSRIGFSSTHATGIVQGQYQHPQQQKEEEKTEEEKKQHSEEVIKYTRLHATSKLTQLHMLLDRTWKSMIRDTNEMKAQFIKSISVGLLVGIIFWQQAKVSEPLYSQGLQKPEVANVSSILFFGMMYMLIANIQSIPYLCARHQLYCRELANNTYAASPYWLSQCITVLPFLIFYQTLFGTLCFLMCGFKLSVENYFYFCSLLTLINMSSYYFAMLLAAITNSERISFAVFPMVYMFLLTFAGYSIPISSVPICWRWATTISYARWGFEGLMVNEWETFDTDDTEYAVNGNGNVLAYYDFEGFNKWDAIWIVLLYVVALMIVTYRFLRPATNKLERVVCIDTSVVHTSAGESGSESYKVSLPVPSIVTDITSSQQATTISNPLLPAIDKMPGVHPVSAEVQEKNIGCTILFKNLSYCVRNKSIDAASTSEQIKILDNVFGIAQPGEMIALMGSSGGGKTTLLDCLAGRKTTGSISGEITFNGQLRSAAVMKDSAYILQDNVHIGVLTVLESLYYAAELRLSETWSSEQKRRRVMQIVDILGLTDVVDTIVGTEEVRGISGGQLKRLSIGVEIVHLPSLLFIDEPTTGLDSQVAHSVLTTLQTFSRSNKTIICTVHQPAPQTYELFDKLILLSGGRVVYFGPAHEAAVSYFLHSTPQLVDYRSGMNPADYMVSVASVYAKPMTVVKNQADNFHNSSSSSSRTSNDDSNNNHHYTDSSAERSSPVSDGPKSKHNNSIDLASIFLSSDEYRTFSSLYDLLFLECQNTQKSGQRVDTLGNNNGTFGGEDATTDEGDAAAVDSWAYYTSTFYQVKTLMSRAVLVTKKKRSLVFANFVRHVAVGAFYGSLYWKLPTGTDQSCYSNRLCLIFFSCTFLVAGHQAAIPDILHNRIIFYRERAARAYGALSYWVSCWILELPLILINVVSFSLIVVYMTEMREDFHSVLFLVLVMYVTSCIGLFVCHVVAALSPSSQAAVSLFPVFLFFSVAFGGFIVYIPQFPAWLGSWAPYGSFVRYAMQSLVLNELKDNPHLPLSQTYIDTLGFDSMNKYQCAPMLLVFLAGFAIWFLAALKFISFEIR